MFMLYAVIIKHVLYLPYTNGCSRYVHLENLKHTVNKQLFKAHNHSFLGGFKEFISLPKKLRLHFEELSKNSQNSVSK